MDEEVDILDDEGNPTGTSTLKSEAHKKGLFHATVHVWCYTSGGQVLLQQRSALKEANPLKWDVSVAGHIGTGESPELAAFREVEEEIGVVIDRSQLQKIGLVKIEKKYSEIFWDREFTHTYLYELNQDTPLTKQESEVEALQWVSLKEFENLVQRNDARFVSNSKTRYTAVIEAIKSRL